MPRPKKRKSADNPSHYWCSVPGCASDGRKKANLDIYPWMQGIQFHPYPGPKRQPKLRRQWLQQVFRDENYSPKRYHSVCSLHFVDGCPTENNPVPTLFPRNNFKNPKNVRKSTSIAKRQSAESSTSTDSVSVSQNSHSTERIAIKLRMAATAKKGAKKADAPAKPKKATKPKSPKKAAKKAGAKKGVKRAGKKGAKKTTKAKK
eukprot:XP_019918675.1 PREDICTED: THAP domain-containing protein 11-like [Crassostrea gigas]